MRACRGEVRSWASARRYSLVIFERVSLTHAAAELQLSLDFVRSFSGFSIDLYSVLRFQCRRQ